LDSSNGKERISITSAVMQDCTETPIDFACHCGVMRTIVFKIEAHQKLSPNYHVITAAERLGNVVDRKRLNMPESLTFQIC